MYIYSYRQFSHLMLYKGRLQNPTASRPPVPSGSGRLSLSRTIETDQNRTEPLVNRRLGFEVVPKQYSSLIVSLTFPTVSLQEKTILLPVQLGYTNYVLGFSRDVNVLPATWIWWKNKSWYKRSIITNSFSTYGCWDNATDKCGASNR